MLHRLRSRIKKLRQSADPRHMCCFSIHMQYNMHRKRGCFKRGGFPIWTCPSFFVLFRPFWDFPDFSGIFFPICSGMVRGFSRLVLFLFLGLLRAPTRNSPERVRDTIWTFPQKSGKHPGLETPRFIFSQEACPPKLWNIVKDRVEEMRPKWPFSKHRAPKIQRNSRWLPDLPFLGVLIFLGLF